MSIRLSPWKKRGVYSAWFITLLNISSIVDARSIDDIPLNYHQRDFGGVGLLQMPTARMLPAGEFSFFTDRVDTYTRAGISAQPYDWFELLFRYTDISDQSYGSYALSGNQSYKDKSVDLKLRLWDETFHRPQLAIGFQDIGGTGLFSSEYIVASKQWRNLDFTLGMSWGYFAHGSSFTNPLTKLSDQFASRDESDETGSISPGNFFSGENAALYGGIEYRPEGTPFTLQLEYDPNNYSDEPFSHDYKQKSHFNIGLTYSISPSLDIRMGYERGSQVMLGVVWQTNFNNQNQSKPLDPKPRVIEKKGIENNPSTEQWPQIAKDLNSNAGWVVNTIKESPHEIRVEGMPTTYRNQAKGVGRASRILTNYTNPEIRWLTFVNENAAGKMNQISIDRNRLVDAADKKISISELSRTGIAISKPEDIGKSVYINKRKRFNYSIGPGFQPTVGGPDNFLLYQISAKANTEYRLSKDTWVSGSAQLGLIDNYDKFTYDAASKLPRVRTYIRQYLTTSKLRMTNLQVTNFEQFSSDFFAQTYIGYLEYGYAGLGAEVLYRPFGKRWALGSDVNYVRQRDFDDRFGLRNYDVITGHATAYYQLPWMENTLAQVSVGRYLAKDIGMTFNLNRQLDNGVRIGVWATLTDVSRSEFGEGSFDKGFYIVVPFDSFFMRSSGNAVVLPWNFLTRDGGQMLSHRYRLYDMTESRNIDAFYKGVDEILQ